MSWIFSLILEIWRTHCLQRASCMPVSSIDECCLDYQRGNFRCHEVPASLTSSSAHPFPAWHHQELAKSSVLYLDEDKTDQLQVLTYMNCTETAWNRDGSKFHVFSTKFKLPTSFMSIIHLNINYRVLGVSTLVLLWSYLMSAFFGEHMMRRFCCADRKNKILRTISIFPHT